MKSPAFAPSRAVFFCGILMPVTFATAVFRAIVCLEHHPRGCLESWSSNLKLPAMAQLPERNPGFERVPSSFRFGTDYEPSAFREDSFLKSR